MSSEQLIAIEVFCTHEGVEISFVEALRERGLIEVIIQEDARYIRPDALPRVEKLARMHYDLEINLEGLEAISHLLERMEEMQEEMRTLQQRLRLHHTDEE